MATLLVTTATSAELKCVKPQFESTLKQLKRESPKIFGDFSLRFLTTGVGNIATTYALTQFLAERNGDGSEVGVDFALNVGVCGMSGETGGGEGCDKLSESTSPPIVQAGSIFHVGSSKERIPPPFVIFAPLVAIACTDTIARSSMDLRGRPYVDMESFAMAYVADHAKIPYALLKCPFDIVGKETGMKGKDELTHVLSGTFDEERIRKMLGSIATYIGKNPKETDISEFRSIYRLTFTEFEQLKKIARKVRATSGMEFEKYLESKFETYPDIPKKDLLSL